MFTIFYNYGADFWEIFEADKVEGRYHQPVPS